MFILSDAFIHRNLIERGFEVSPLSLGWAKSHLCNTEERRAICLCPEIAIRRRKSLHWNRNTMKFHSADCPSVNDMNEENKVAIATREEALALGYAPCKRCNP